MRANFVYSLSLGLILLYLLACEDVVEIDTPSEPPRLVVKALLRVDINAPSFPVEIKVSQTDNFFGTIPVTELERIVILIEESDNGIIVRTSDLVLNETTPGTGIYGMGQGIPTSTLENDINFMLIITHEGRRYFAQTRYVAAVPITSVAQGSGTLFDEDETEVIVSFKDDPDADNFYIFDFDFNEFLVTEDEFYQGQDFEFSYFYDRKFESGKNIEISILGADKPLFDYMSQLIEQTEDLQGPFQTPVATVRGNIFDITGLDNVDIFDNVERPNAFPLGYFAIVQEYKQTLVIE
ncbi:MAG: DUF4249 family protein [Flavobacteriaceae bacterium]